MANAWHFPIVILMSLIAVVGVLFAVLHHRSSRPTSTSVVWVAGIVVVGGMLFARMGTTVGLLVWLYYGIPAVVTWVLPPLVFRMRGSEVAKYLPLAVSVAPVPALWELIG